MSEETLEAPKPTPVRLASSTKAPAKSQEEKADALEVKTEAATGIEFPKELLSDQERVDKMIRDSNIKVLLIVGPNTPTEKQIPLPTVARAIKARFTA